MFSLSRLLSRHRPPVQPHKVTINAAGDVIPLLNWAGNRRLRLLLPTSFLTLQGAFAPLGWHPFVAALQEGSERLRWFYRRFRPTTVEAMHMQQPPDDSAPSLAEWELPWLLADPRRSPRGEKGLSNVHGVSFYGPASDDKIALEYRRLVALRDSIARSGYQPDEDGDVRGHFMRRGSELKFFVRGGKHRTAVLAHLGFDQIPVTFKGNWPRCVDIRDSADWPLVRLGEISEAGARALYDTYFDWDGREQLRRLERQADMG